MNSGAQQAEYYLEPSRKRVIKNIFSSSALDTQDDNSRNEAALVLACVVVLVCLKACHHHCNLLKQIYRLPIADDTESTDMRSVFQLLILWFAVVGAVRDGDAVAGANQTDSAQSDFTDSGTEICMCADDAEEIFSVFVLA